MDTWAAVVRVSHMGKRKANSDMFHADSDQVAEIERYAARHGARLTFLDPELSVSGGEPIEKRPSLKAAIEGVEAGEYSGIVVANLKRLTRSRSGIEIWERVEAAGGHVHCAAENIDTSTPNGRFIRDIHLADAVREREEHTERFEARREHATAAGIWQRRQTPRGYRKNKQTRRLVPDRQAEQVQAAARDFLAGSPISELARRLKMTTSGVRAMLRNRVYLGELKVGEHVKRKAHPAILDIETFEAIQAKLGNGARPTRNGNGPALLAGLVRCSSCGHLLTRGNSRGEPTYQCPTRHSKEHCPSPVGITTARLDAYVEPIARAELAELQHAASEGDQVEDARRKLVEAERELAGYLEAVDTAGIGTSTASEGMRKRQEAVDTAKDELRAEMARRPAVPNVGSAADVWDGLNAHERNTLLSALLAAVVVRPVGRGRRVPVGDRARVLEHGVRLELPASNGHEAGGIVPIPFPDTDSEGVLS